MKSWVEMRPLFRVTKMECVWARKKLGFFAPLFFGLIPIAPVLVNSVTSHKHWCLLCLDQDPFLSGIGEVGMRRMLCLLPCHQWYDVLRSDYFYYSFSEVEGVWGRNWVFAWLADCMKRGGRAANSPSQLSHGLSSIYRMSARRYMHDNLCSPFLIYFYIFLCLSRHE